VTGAAHGRRKKSVKEDFTALRERWKDAIGRDRSSAKRQAPPPLPRQVTF
jgi:hypothetical protein